MKTFRMTIRGADNSTRHERIRAPSRSEAWERAELTLRKGEQVVNCCEV